MRLLRKACRERDGGVYPAAPFYARPPARAELLLGYATLRERKIRTGVRQLCERWTRSGDGIRRGENPLADERWSPVGWPG